MERLLAGFVISCLPVEGYRGRGVPDLRSVADFAQRSPVRALGKDWPEFEAFRARVADGSV